MTIQDAINSGKKVRRKNWVNPAFKEFDLWNDLDSLDILATDWEVEKDGPTEIVVEDIEGDILEVQLGHDGKVYLCTNPGKEFPVGVTLRDFEVDKILTFLYNNTEIGKKRVIPF